MKNIVYCRWSKGKYQKRENNSDNPLIGLSKIEGGIYYTGSNKINNQITFRNKVACARY